MMTRTGFQRILLALLPLLLLALWFGMRPAGSQALTPTPAPPTPQPTAAPETSPAATPEASAGQGGDIDGVSWLNLDPEKLVGWQITQQEPMVLTIAPASTAEVEGPAYRVYALLYKESSAYDIALNKLAELYASKKINITFTVVNFDRDNEVGLRRLEEAVAAKYDLIFSMGSETTDFLYANFKGGAIPVVSVVAKDPVLLGQIADYEVGSGTNFAFTSVNVPIDLQMTYLQELKPELRNIGILYDASNKSAVTTQVEPLRAVAEARGITVIDVDVSGAATAEQELALKVPQAVQAMGSSDPGTANSVFWITGSTSVFDSFDVIDAHAGNVPVLSVFPELVREGDQSAVLSIGVSFETNAHLAGIYGLQILQGDAQAGELHVGVVTPPDIAINFRKARAIGMRVPFRFFESATFVYDYEGTIVREAGQVVGQ